VGDYTLPVSDVNYHQYNILSLPTPYHTIGDACVLVKTRWD